jgi:hypothetical protein
MRQIQRFVVDEHVEQHDKVGLEVSENGIGREPRPDGGAGWEESRVCE